MICSSVKSDFEIGWVCIWVYLIPILKSLVFLGLFFYILQKYDKVIGPLGHLY